MLQCGNKNRRYARFFGRQIKRIREKEKIEKLQKRRDQLWEDFCRLSKKDSFSGLRISGELNAVQQKLDKLEGNKRSKRHYTEINIEVF